jgi:FtsZ-binding cell division protein ZapB
MCTFYLDDQKFRNNIQVLMGVLDRKIHKAIELDQLILLEIGLLQDRGKNDDVLDPETAEAYEAITSRTLEIGEILQEIRKRLHSDLLTVDAVPKESHKDNDDTA